MPFQSTPLPGLLIFEPAVHRDERGYFTESYNARVFEEAGILATFVQDNQAHSRYGVVRGLHYQCGSQAQAKLVRVFSGEVLDVVVDLRSDSPTYGQSFSICLSGENMLQLFVPRGFAHGYAVLSPEAVFFYKCDHYYHRESEGGIHPLDPGLALDWMVPPDQMIISEKDQGLPVFGKHRPIHL